MARKTINIKTEIAGLGDLDRVSLTELWTKTYDCPTPFGMRQPLLLRSAAWHLQRLKLGPMPGRTQRQLTHAMKRLETELDVGTVPPTGNQNDHQAWIDGKFGLADDGPDARRGRLQEIEVPPMIGDASRAKVGRTAKVRNLPAPGSRLLREWNGRTYIVDVVSDGYVFDGKTYRSLTSVAKQITGIHRSGPEFFGL